MQRIIVNDFSDFSPFVISSIFYYSEYYFSDDNLQRDFYLRHKMDSEGYLPITLIASFPRLKALSTDIQLVLSAVQESDQLELFKNFKVRPKNEPAKWPIKTSAEVPEDQSAHSATESGAAAGPTAPTPAAAAATSVPKVQSRAGPTAAGMFGYRCLFFLVYCI